MREAAIQYLEHSPDFAMGMMAGFQFAKAVLTDSEGAWRELARRATDEPPGAA